MKRKSGTSHSILLFTQVSPIPYGRDDTRVQKVRSQGCLGGWLPQTSPQSLYTAPPPLETDVSSSELCLFCLLSIFSQSKIWTWADFNGVSEPEGILKTTSQSSVSSLHRWRTQSLELKCLLCHLASYRQGSTHSPQPRLFPTLFSWKLCFVKWFITCETGICEVQQL